MVRYESYAPETGIQRECLLMLEISICFILLPNSSWKKLAHIFFVLHAFQRQIKIPLIALGTILLRYLRRFLGGPLPVLHDAERC